MGSGGHLLAALLQGKSLIVTHADLYIKMMAQAHYQGVNVLIGRRIRHVL